MTADVVVVSPAKINLSLAVGAPRPDGFHPLATVYQAIGLYDEVGVSHAESGITVSVTGDGLDVSGVPTDESNLAARAVRLLAARHGIDAGVAVTIRKRIPAAGGLAGGSTDAAAALVACDALWGTGTPRDELLAIAAELGSDVPFCLVGHTALGSGRGELVTPVMARGGYWWVLAISDSGLATPAVYAEFDRIAQEPQEPEVPNELLAALRAGDVVSLGKALTNDLQPAALRLRPELQELLARGREASAHGALVSGSGPTCLFLAEDETHAAQVRDELIGEADHLLVAPGPVAGARVVR